MSSKFSGHTSVHIAASQETVWKFLTEPELVGRYLHGTELKTDWKTGSCVTFSGEYQGKTYHDKGVVLAFKPYGLLSYSYWSSMSGLADKPDNYMAVTFRLKEDAGGTALEVNVANIISEQTRDHAVENWKKVLASLKIMIEDSAQVAAY